MSIELIWRTGRPAAHVRGREADGFPLGLTSRELEVATLLVSGMTSAQIAQALVLSPRTVTTHVDRLMQKFEAPNRATVATIA